MSTSMRKKYFEEGASNSNPANNITHDDDDDDYEEPKNATAPEEEEEEHGLFEFVVNQLNKFFVDHIPVDNLKELPPVYMYYGGIVAYISAFSLFAYFVSTSYLAAMSQSYIATETSSGNCDSVSIAVSGDYLADRQGNWVGSSDFLYSQAKYGVTFNNFQVSSFSEYQLMMSVFQQALNTIGAMAQTQNLPFSLLVWISFIRYYSVEDPTATNFTSIGYGQLQYIQMTGSAPDIYDLPNQIVSIGGSNGTCPLHAGTDFDKANSIIKTSLSYDLYAENPLCWKSLPPLQYGYAPAIDDGQFSILLNVETFALAMSVNLGVISVWEMSQASTTLIPLSLHGATYLLGQYFDNRNLDMEPMWCMYNTSVIPPDSPNIQYLCFYIYSRTVAMPVFNHLGTSNVDPIYCECGVNGNTNACNNFNLMSGLLLYPLTDNGEISPIISLTNQITYMFALLAEYDGDYYAFNRDAYNASWTLATKILGIQGPEYITTEWYNSVFDFCVNSDNQTCSIILFNSLATDSAIVSQYKYTLRNGSCSDSISISAQYWSKLEAVAPVQLTQDYYKCYPTRLSAFFNALGIASGNTALAVPIIVVFLLPLLYLILVLIRQVPPREEYNKLEKEQAVDILALLLLRLRDGKTRGTKKGGVLVRLCKEIVAAAKEEGGFPDSDDEDEDEDEAPRPSSRKFSLKVTNHVPAGGAAGRAEVELPPPDSDDEEEEEAEGEEKGEERAYGVRPSEIRRRKSRRESKMRRSSLGAGAGAGAGGKRGKRKERLRMGVFVKQLEADEKEREKGAGAGGRRGSSKPSPSPSSPPPAPSSVFSYLFGGAGTGGTRDSTTEGVELEGYRGENPMQGGVIDLSREGERVPEGMLVLNNLEGELGTARKKKPMKPEHLEVLINDLISSFSRALSSSSPKASPAFLEGGQLARRLGEVDFGSLGGQESVGMYLKLSNAMCMHASIELFCEMRQVEREYAERIAYQVGDHIVTAASLAAMLA